MRLASCRWWRHVKSYSNIVGSVLALIFINLFILITLLLPPLSREWERSADHVAGLFGNRYKGLCNVQESSDNQNLTKKYVGQISKVSKVKLLTVRLLGCRKWRKWTKKFRYCSAVFQWNRSKIQNELTIKSLSALKLWLFWFLLIFGIILRFGPKFVSVHMPCKFKVAKSLLDSTVLTAQTNQSKALCVVARRLFV